VWDLNILFLLWVLLRAWGSLLEVLLFPQVLLLWGVPLLSVHWEVLLFLVALLLVVLLSSVLPVLLWGLHRLLVVLHGVLPWVLLWGLLRQVLPWVLHEVLLWGLHQLRGQTGVTT